MDDMHKRFPTCEHNVKRLRTCHTAISKYPVLFTTEVPSLLELCAHKVSKHYKNSVKTMLQHCAQYGAFNNKTAQLLIHYSDDTQFSELLSSAESFLRAPGYCNLTELCLEQRNLDGMTSEDVMKLLGHHRLDSLSMSESDITHQTISNIAQSQQDLLHLDISFCLRIEIFDSIFQFKNLTYLNLERTHFKLTPSTAHCFFSLKQLRWLGMAKLKKHNQTSPLSIQLLTSVTNELIGLDLSETLWDIKQHFRLKHFKALQQLDISYYPTHTEEPARFDDVIESTLSAMTSLRSLDISSCRIEHQEKIYKLKPLNLSFLGIVGNDLFYIQDIDSLADKVASHRKLEHILVLLRKYRNNIAVLEQALKSLFTLHRNRIELGYCSAHIEPQLFEAVLCTLERFPTGTQIQHVASACLYTLNNKNELTLRSNADQEPYPGYDRQVRRAITLLTISVNVHTYERDVLRNCMGMLLQFCSYQKDYMFFEIIHSLINVLEQQKGVLEQSRVLSIEDPLRETARKICTFTVRNINNIICQTTCSKKHAVGRMQLIETILDISRLSFSMFQQSPHETESLDFCLLLLESWSTLWNITDEQASNCDKFVENGGLELYHETYLVCSQVRTDDQTVASSITTLIRNMLGLMGNIAEVPHIRPQLLKDDIIYSFYLLRNYDRPYENVSDLIEIRYSAAGILSHICSDGPDTWTVTRVTYQDILDGIEESVDSWDIKSKRTINYKSFNPILHILRVQCPYQCKLWAVWALTNLCHCKPKRFVPMLRRDGGVQLLNKLNEDPSCPENVRGLCTFTLVKAYDPNIGSDIEE